MDINTIAYYALLFAGAVLLVVLAYYLLRAVVGGIVLLLKIVVELLKLVFKALYFLLLIVLIAGGIQLTLESIRSFPNHSLYSVAWTGIGVVCVAIGLFGLALRIREHRKRPRGKPAIPSSPAGDYYDNSYNDEQERREKEAQYWKERGERQRAEEAEVERQFQLMKEKQTEREQAYQNWVAEQEEIAERNRQHWDSYRRDDG